MIENLKKYIYLIKNLQWNAAKTRKVSARGTHIVGWYFLSMIIYAVTGCRMHSTNLYVFNAALQVILSFKRNGE